MSRAGALSPGWRCAFLIELLLLMQLIAVKVRMSSITKMEPGGVGRVKEKGSSGPIVDR